MKIYSVIKNFFPRSTLPEPTINLAGQVTKMFENSSKADRILVLSAHTNDPNMLELQSKAIRKYFKFDHDFVVGIDIPPSDSKWNLFEDIEFEHFQKIAVQNHIKLLEIPQEIHRNRSLIFPFGKPSNSKPNFAMRCADSFQFMLGIVPWEGYSTILFLDADMLPVTQIHEIPTSGSIYVAGIKQIRKNHLKEVEYLWPGLVWINTRCPMRNLLSFDLISRLAIKTDVGGESSSWIKFLTNFGYGVRYLEHLSSGSWHEAHAPASISHNFKLVQWLKNDYRNSKGFFFSEIYDDKFLHYRGGGNWMSNDSKKELENRKKLLDSLNL